MSNFAFDSFNHFILMDGHGIYVWLVYAVSTFIIVAFFWTINRKIKLLAHRLKNASN